MAAVGSQVKDQTLTYQSEELNFKGHNKFRCQRLNIRITSRTKITITILCPQ